MNVLLVDRKRHARPRFDSMHARRLRHVSAATSPVVRHKNWSGHYVLSLMPQKNPDMTTDQVVSFRRPVNERGLFRNSFKTPVQLGARVFIPQLFQRQKSLFKATGSNLKYHDIAADAAR